jgi:hypothetical protein
MGVHLMGVYLINVHPTGVYLMGVHIMGVHLMSVHLVGVYLMGVYLTGVHLMGVYLINMYLTGVHLMSVHLTGLHLMGVCLIGLHFMGVHLIYESSLRAGHWWRESLYRHPGWFKASDCGRLGRRAAGHPWSALRVVKSCRKDRPTASVLPKPKQQLCIQSGTRAHYLNYLPKREGEAGKRSAGNRIG